MAGLFWIQLRALIWKNWIVLSKHWFVSGYSHFSPFLCLNILLVQPHTLLHLACRIWSILGCRTNILQ